MPSLFDELFSSIGFPALGNVFGEPGEYLFRNGQIESFSEGVIIYRNPPEMVNEKGEVYQPTFLVEVAIDPKLIDTGGDRMQIKEHANDDNFKTYAVVKLISQIGLISYLELR